MKKKIYTKIEDMEMNINYLMDSNGNKIAVQIPFAQWASFMKDYQRLQQYTSLKSDLKIAFNEIEEIEKGNKVAVTLSEFLNEN